MKATWIPMWTALLVSCSNGNADRGETRGVEVDHSQQQSTDEQQIRSLQNQWMQAWVDQDRDTVEKILAPEYQLIVSSMPDRPITREQWIGMLPRYTAEGFKYDKMAVRIFGDMAVVSSLLTPTSAKVDGDDRSFTFFITDVWKKSDDRWQVVGRYSSMPEENTASSQALERR